jgi:hypothetical protein
MLSSLLFVIVIEISGKMIATTVRVSLLSSFSVECENVGWIDISHLLFANDTINFYGANPIHLCNLRRLFLCFESVSGLKIN